MGEVIRTLRNRRAEHRPRNHQRPLPHDLGLAVANSLVAIESGAGQVECTVNGLGERAGNCSLEEIVMALRTRGDYYHAATGIQTRRLVPTSRLAANITGIHVQRNKAIVGQNALPTKPASTRTVCSRNERSYEIMHPRMSAFRPATW